ncbi:serine hydrolase [Flavobacteriaceae bacterium R33]|uniref:Serine hydrolase n=2 Tax=Poritiphilus flavus TaxID=2697053 RepID=A0A6L9EFJ4_9FLAO|nr:serine hydrolase [Poritiphilus flavus]
MYLLVLMCVHLITAQESYQYRSPVSSNDGLETTSLFSTPTDSTNLYKLFDQLLNEDHKIHSALLLIDNKLVLEEYFGGYGPDKTHDLRSATKPIISLLMGIALDRGIIESIDDPISRYLKNPIPEKNIDPRKNEISIRHLLTMSSGLDCDDWDKRSAGQEDKVYRKKDWLQFTLNLPMVEDPGVSARYCSMGVVLAAEIIAQASGMPIAEFADRYLFHPMGITNLSWGHTSTSKAVIPSSKRLYMRPRDLAKIGLLVHNKGKWNAEQLVSEEWIALSTSKQTTLANLDYGFLWWHIPFKTQNGTAKAITATGNGGQYIFVLEELDMIAVFTGGAYNSEKSKVPFAIVNNVFIPLLEDKDP